MARLPPAKRQHKGSNPLVSSKFRFNGCLADWLCTGLQIQVDRFDSGSSLQFKRFKEPYFLCVSSITGITLVHITRDVVRSHRPLLIIFILNISDYFIKILINFSFLIMFNLIYFLINDSIFPYKSKF